MVPDIDEEVKDEFQELKAHDDGDAQVQAQGASQARHQAWFLKIWQKGVHFLSIAVQSCAKRLLLIWALTLYINM